MKALLIALLANDLLDVSIREFMMFIAFSAGLILELLSCPLR